MAFKTGKQSKQSEKEKSEFESKVLDVARVTRVAAGGKRFRFRVTLVLGNRKGKVGIGVDKGADVAQAIEKATRAARKGLIAIPIVNDTIPHAVIGKYSSAKILLKPRLKGRGLVVGSAARAICDLSGIKNISGKILSRSTNKLNIARATMEALKKLKPIKKSEELQIDQQEEVQEESQT